MSQIVPMQVVSTSQTPNDVHSIDRLISWLETKSGSYDFMSNGHCLLAQYYTDCGYGNIRVGSFEFTYGDHELDVRMPDEFVFIALGHDGRSYYDRSIEHSQWTFEKALQRARKAKCKSFSMQV